MIRRRFGPPNHNRSGNNVHPHIAAIFFLIAGTYTPFVLIKMHNAWGLALLGVVWTIAAIGIVIKLFFPRYLEPFAPERIVSVKPGDKRMLTDPDVTRA